MEKLIELLNQYNIELHGVDRAYKDGFDLAYEQEYMRDFRVAYLISKKFEFIKWLVENNKINFDKVNKVYYKKIYCGTDGKYISYAEFLDEEILIMRLSISDSPVNDLISYLK